jgi:hypothetical protein
MARFRLAFLGPPHIELDVARLRVFSALRNESPNAWIDLSRFP